jgi:hypothetical protein
LNLSLELVKVGFYDFPYSCDGSLKNHLLFKRPLADTDFDMPALEEHSASTLNMKAACSSKTMVYKHKFTRGKKPENPSPN